MLLNVLKLFSISFFSAASIQRFRFIYDKKTRDFSSNKVIKLLKQNYNSNICSVNSILISFLHNPKKNIFYHSLL